MLNQTPSNQQIQELNSQKFQISLQDFNIYNPSDEPATLDVDNVQNFRDLNHMFFNIIQRGTSSEILLQKMNNSLKLSERPLNLKTLFQIFFNNSDHELKIKLLKIMSKKYPIPLIYQNQDLKNIQKKEENFTLNHHLFYLFIDCFTIINLSLSETNKQIGKTELINEIFYSQNKFETSDLLQINQNTIDIAFDFDFIGSRNLTVADAHGIIPLPILQKILPLFKLWIVQMDTESELKDNFNNLNSLIKQNSPKICFIVRNSTQNQQEQYKAIINEIQSQNIEIYFMKDLTKQNKQVQEEEIANASKFIFKQVESERYLNKNLVNQNDFLNIISNYSEECKLVANEIHSDQDIVEQIITQLEEFAKEPLGFYSPKAFPIRNIDYQIKEIQRELKLQNIKQQVNELGKLKKKLQITQVLRLFSSIFQRKNSYLIYNLFTARLRILNDQFLFALRKEAKELHDKLYELTSGKDKSLEEQRIQEEIVQIKLKINNNLRKTQLVDIETNNFWQEIFAFNQESVTKELQIDPAKLFSEMISKGEPFQLFERDVYSIDPQFLKEMVSNFKEKGNEKILILSVLGPQGSGKSTLLNKMFGSCFQNGNDQHTKGIQLQLLKYKQQSEDDNLDYILLLDTEGQCKENFEFQQQIYLFIQAISEIVLINVKEQIDSSFRSFLQRCLYPQTQLIKKKVNNLDFSPYFGVCFNENTGNDLDKIYSQVMELALLSQNSFDEEAEQVQHNNYIEILSLRKNRIKILGNSQSTQKWQSRSPSENFQDCRQLVENQAYSIEAQNFGIQIIKDYRWANCKQQSSLNSFTNQVKQFQSNLQLFPEYLECSEFYQFILDQSTQTQFQAICSQYNEQIIKSLADEVEKSAQNKINLEDSKILLIQKEQEIQTKFNQIKQSQIEELIKIKEKKDLLNEFIIKYLQNLEQTIEFYKIQCKMEIFQEIYKLSINFQEKHGFPQIKSQILELLKQPQQLDQLLHNEELQKQKFDTLWLDVVAPLDKKQQQMFQVFSKSLLSNILQNYPNLTIKSEQIENLCTLSMEELQELGSKSNQSQFNKLYQEFQTQLEESYFIQIPYGPNKEEYMKIILKSIHKLIEENSSKDLIQITDFYHYHVIWMVVDKQDMENQKIQITEYFESQSSIQTRRDEISLKYVITDETLTIVPKNSENGLFLDSIKSYLQMQFYQRYEKQKKIIIREDAPYLFNNIITEKKLWQKVYSTVYNAIKLIIDQILPSNNKYKENIEIQKILTSNVISSIKKKMDFEIDNFDRQFSKLGMILSEIGRRFIYQYGFMITWRLLCQIKWELLLENQNWLEETKQKEFVNFRYEIHFQEFDLSLIQQIQTKICLQFIEGFYKKQCQQAQIDIIKKIKETLSIQNLESYDLIEFLDQKLLCEFKQLNNFSPALNYMNDQTSFINSYVDSQLAGIKEQFQLSYQSKLQSELKIYLTQIKSNLNKLKCVLNDFPQLKANNFFINKEQNNEICEQKLFQLVLGCLQGEFSQEQNHIFQEIDEQNKQAFKESNYFKINQPLIAQALQGKDLSIQQLQFYVQTLSDQLNLKINDVSSLQLNIKKLKIQSLLEKIEVDLKGCQSFCPVCLRKCDLNCNFHEKHQCQNGHQILSMRGVLFDQQLALLTCEEMDDRQKIKEYNNYKCKTWYDIINDFPDWQFKPISKANNIKNTLKMNNIWNSGVGKYLCQLKKDLEFELRESEEITEQSVHYIFVLDDSGSMGGQRWEQAKNCTVSTMKYFEQNPNAKVSVILFNHMARLIIDCENIKVEQQKNMIEFEGGCTDFDQAFKIAYNQIDKYKNANFQKIFILFYTDGEAQYPKEAINLFQSLPSTIKEKLIFKLCMEQQSNVLDKMAKDLQQHCLSIKLFKDVKPEDATKCWHTTKYKDSPVKCTIQ